MELLENNITELKQEQYKAENEERKRQLKKTIYKEASFIDKIKIRIRSFFEK